jgi:hypothetical protein
MAALLFYLLTVAGYFIPPITVLAFAIRVLFSTPELSGIALLYTLAFSIPIYRVIGSLEPNETCMDPAVTVTVYDKWVLFDLVAPAK